MTLSTPACDCDIGGSMSMYGSGQTWNERISFGFEKIGSLSKGCACVWGDVSYGKRGT